MTGRTEANRTRRTASDIIGPDKDPHLDDDNPFEAMMARFDHAAERLDLDPGIYRVLRMPEKQLIVSVPIQLDNAEIEVFTGYRVVHNTARGPGKGGIRFDQRVTLDEVKALDIPAPDVNTNERVMAWIMDTYSMHERHPVTAVVTGKPIEMGGSLGRREATGRGCMLATREALKYLGLPLRGTKVAVQGFGNVGSTAAALLEREGLTVVAASDISGAIYNPNGIIVEGAIAWVREHRYLAGYPGAEEIPTEQVITMDVDVLLPAAVENAITRNNAADVRAKVICEGANGPTTPGADRVLEEKGVFVIPDILANAGGVTVSYFEWVQDRMGYFWDEAMINERLEGVITRSFRDVISVAERHSVNMRIAAYMLAIERVAAVHRLRGLYA